MVIPCSCSSSRNACSSADNLGAGNDTSNFLFATQLYNNGTSNVTGSGPMGTVDLDQPIATSGLIPVTAVDGDGNGRFFINGTEIAFSPDAQLAGAGCDVEVAEVTIGARHWWTFAFAAFGPQDSRRDALLASWSGLVTATPCPESIGARIGRAMGYPEWLALTV